MPDQASHAPWLLTGALLLPACAPVSVGVFPEADPQLQAQNAAAGDPYQGRFPYADAVAGLPEGQPLAILVTEAGEIHCQLAFDTAPLAVANFIGLARGLRPWRDAASGEWRSEAYYVDLPWHRVEERQFVQTGLRGEGPGADASIGYVLQDERSIGDAFDRPGVIALANDKKPNSSAAQFFVTTAELRGLDGQFTIIGRCSDQAVIREVEGRALAGEGPRLLSVSIEMERQ